MSDDCGWRERLDARMEATIAEFGWNVTAVAPVQGQAGNVWAYTIGVEDKGGPEFLMVGLPPRLIQTILNSVVQDCLDHSRWWKDGDRIEGQLEGDYVLLAVQVPADVVSAGDWFNVAKRRRRLLGRSASPLYVLQLVWPDADGRHEPSDLQPILGRP